MEEVGNITEQELDRDLINLHLPEPKSYFATEAELIALYGETFYCELLGLGKQD
ncbi:hypothetical protein [Solirubrum puertoriconensis]|uniref:hypothetical protein n=1 Tax=Solirubrum puertoriconensis TaxID=1751427 RepID=UPI0013666947|nr:hypothetical protein [Solirubrum puertoriconensis]